MSLLRCQLSHRGKKGRNYMKTLRLLKKNMNHYIRRRNKVIADDDIGCKTSRKHLVGWYD